MKVIYKAFDGTEFGTSDDCIKYEATRDNGNIQMFSVDGKRTNDVSCAYFIFIPFKQNPDDEMVIGAKWFVQKCKEYQEYEEEDFFWDGIDEYSSGFYFWSEYDECYHWIEDEALSILMKNFVNGGVLWEKDVNLT